MKSGLDFNSIFLNLIYQFLLSISALISNFPNLSVTSSRLGLGIVCGRGGISGRGIWGGGGSSTLPACERGVSLPLMLGVPRPLTLAEIMSDILSLSSSSSTEPTEWLDAASENASWISLVFPVRDRSENNDPNTKVRGSHNAHGIG